MPPSGDTQMHNEPAQEQSRRAVWKYAIELGDPEGATDVRIPEGARFLHCAAQGDAVCMWFEVPVDSPRVVKRRFRLFGTGDPTIDTHLSYVGTGIFADGAYVFHLYEASLDDIPPKPACADHKPVQHRDGKEPWCKACGLNAKGTEASSRLRPAEHGGNR